MCAAADDLAQELDTAVGEIVGSTRLKWQKGKEERHGETRVLFEHCDDDFDGKLDEAESLALLTCIVQRRKDEAKALEAQQAEEPLL